MDHENRSYEPEEMELIVAEKLAYEFTDRELLRRALTHRSFRNENPKLGPQDNERLEFLGDSILGVGISMMLYTSFPEAREGELTRKRADLVCESTLAQIARELGAGGALRLGRGEDKSGGREKPRLLASAFEALIGAVYVDSNLFSALNVVEHVFLGRLAEANDQRDHKSRLQEWGQKVHQQTPVYQIVRSEGPDHARSFFVVVHVGDRSAEGQGRSKAEAERDAARRILLELELIS